LSFAALKFDRTALAQAESVIKPSGNRDRQVPDGLGNVFLELRCGLSPAGCFFALLNPWRWSAT
jgi:hypothetical protein